VGGQSIARAVDHSFVDVITSRRARARNPCLRHLLPADDRARFHQLVDRFAEPLSFANVIVLAVVLHAMFHTRRPLFVQHGVFGMHSMTVVLLSTPLVLPVLWLLARDYERAALAGIFAVIAWQFGYLVAAV
jgi:hypothetical protein